MQHSTDQVHAPDPSSKLTMQYGGAVAPTAASPFGPQSSANAVQASPFGGSNFAPMESSTAYRPGGAAPVPPLTPTAPYSAATPPTLPPPPPPASHVAAGGGYGAAPFVPSQPPSANASSMYGVHRVCRVWMALFTITRGGYVHFFFSAEWYVCDGVKNEIIITTRTHSGDGVASTIPSPHPPLLHSFHPEDILRLTRAWFAINAA